MTGCKNIYNIGCQNPVMTGYKNISYRVSESRYDRV